MNPRKETDSKKTISEILKEINESAFDSDQHAELLTSIGAFKVLRDKKKLAPLGTEHADALLLHARECEPGAEEEIPTQTNKSREKTKIPKAVRMIDEAVEKKQKAEERQAIKDAIIKEIQEKKEKKARRKAEKKAKEEANQAEMKAPQQAKEEFFKQVSETNPEDEFRKFLNEFREQGFGSLSENQAENAYFQDRVKIAYECWFKSFKRCNGITKEQFSETVYQYLNETGYLGSLSCLRNLTQKHLDSLFDIYALAATEHPYRMGLMEFCHIFLLILRENVIQEAKEISLAESIDAVAAPAQTRKLREKMKFLSLSHATTRVTHLGTPIITLAEGMIRIKDTKQTSYGFCPILHVKHESGVILHLPLMYCNPVASQVGFSDHHGRAHKDLSHLDKLIDDLTKLTLPELDLFLSEMGSSKCFTKQEMFCDEVVKAPQDAKALAPTLFKPNAISLPAIRSGDNKQAAAPIFRSLSGGGAFSKPRINKPIADANKVPPVSTQTLKS
jgi:hypothetical protein